MNETRNVPKLRFKEFTESWNNTTLGKISKNIMYGMNSASKTFDGENKYIRITDINENSNKFIANPLTSPDGNLKNEFLLKKGDIVFARTGASTGKSYLYNLDDGKLYFAGFLIKFHIFNANPKFVFYLTLRDSYINWVKIFSVRSGQPGINAEEYKKLKINLPSVKEQNKISYFLISIDKKIDLLYDKEKYLKDFKNYCMQNIFSEKLRFKNLQVEDNSDWKKFILKDILLSSSSNLSMADLEDNFGDYKLYGATGFIKCIDFFDQKGGYMAIVKDGAGVGKTFLCDPKSSVLSTLLYLTPKKDYNLKFCYYLLKTLHFGKYKVGSTIPHIYYKDFSKEKVFIPSVEEQEEIASFLTAIDKKIDLTQNQITEMEKFKKGLLQEMFV